MNILVTFILDQKYIGKLRSSFPGLNICILEQAENEEQIASAEVVLHFNLMGFINTELLTRLPRLKWIQVLSAGVDNLPWSEVQKRGVVVTNGKGVHKIQMTEHALSFILQLARNSFQLYRNQTQNVWQRKVEIEEIYGKTLLVIGTGAIGCEIARKAKVFGMRTKQLIFLARIWLRLSTQVNLAEILLTQPWVISADKGTVPLSDMSFPLLSFALVDAADGLCDVARG